MIGKVLVANRGEIAVRIVRACRRCNVKSVAVYTEPDQGAPHVSLADEAYPLEAASPAQGYLNQTALLAIARASGCDAVHPGYGFLAENAQFASAVEHAGMVWIGPTPQSIDIMGNKQRARELAASLGVPVVPGRTLTACEDVTLVQAATSLGLPVLVKASGGGGGIGMRVVEREDDLLAAIRATRDLASKYFGDAAVYLERFVPSARHIEVQVFGYGDGKAIHLYERDCSIQRRYQKVIEEAPAVDVPQQTLQAMRSAALTLACDQEYRGAGTVEFLYDTETGSFYFLEMNTRIQVEHPVTEMITGLDLVAMQIELAAGKLAAVPQASIKAAGHAIECRVYAERPAKRFLPSTGRLEVFVPPPESADLRVETGYSQNMQVTHFYDPLLAKVIAWGQSRQAAAARMHRALGAFQIRGVETNLGMLRAIVSHEAVLSSAPTTQFLSQHPQVLTA